MAIIAMLTIFKKSAGKAVVTLDAFVKEFGANNPVIIDAVFAPNGISVVVAIFVVMAAGVHVAVFIVGFLVYEFAVLVVFAKKGDEFGSVDEFSELFEKRTIEVEVAALIDGIPFIRPPTILAVDVIFFVGRIKRNHLFLAAFAFS